MILNLKSLAIATVISLTTISFANNVYSQEVPISQTPNETQPTQATTATDWKEIVSDKGNFTIKMPGEALYKKEGESGYTYELQNDLGIFSISFSSFGPELANSDPKPVLDELANSLAQNGGKIISQQDLTINNYPGREVVFEVVEGYVQGTSRIYIIGDQLFLLLAIADANNAQTFFDSFALQTE